MRMLRDGQHTPEFFQKMIEDSRKITEAVDNDITKSLEELENEFRKILGVV